ncbi:MAG: hypothetical protein ACO2OX_04470 [Candidatus Nanopusillus sp.]|jgi:hypothetical protein
MRKSDIAYKRKLIALLKILNMEDRIYEVKNLKTIQEINKYLFYNEDLKERFKMYLRVLMENRNK